MGRPPLSRLRRRFAPLRGTQRRPSGALRALRAARAAFLETYLFYSPPHACRMQASGGQAFGYPDTEFTQMKAQPSQTRLWLLLLILLGILMRPLTGREVGGRLSTRSSSASSGGASPARGAIYKLWYKLALTPASWALGRAVLAASCRARAGL